VNLKAPFASPDFTIKVSGKTKQPRIINNGSETQLQRVDSKLNLKENTWYKDKKGGMLCFNLPKGMSNIYL